MMTVLLSVAITLITGATSPWWSEIFATEQPSPQPTPQPTSEPTSEPRPEAALCA